MKTILALLLSCLTAQAQLVVSWTGGNDVSVGPGVASFDFTEGPIARVAQGLGIWDASGTGLAESHAVGLWDFTTQALLASTTVVPSTATAINQFWYEPIAPITLQAGHKYMLGAFYQDNSFDLAHANATATVLAGATLGDAWLSSASTFSFPDINVSGADQGFFGPSISFAPVPEPGAMAFVVGLLLLAFTAVRTQAGPIRDILDARSSARRSKIIATLPHIQRRVVATAVPAENRPPVTPGNEHGKRPVVPPGLANYASP